MVNLLYVEHPWTKNGKDVQAKYRGICMRGGGGGDVRILDQRGEWINVLFHSNYNDIL